MYFLLRDKLPFTPDFGSSDAFHSNVSFKYYLWQSIRSGVLPFWTDKLAGGFPLIAETQIGAFFLPHFLIFPLFSNFPHAYIFLFAFHLFLLSVGMFLLLKWLKVSPFLSFLLAITLTWSGAVSFRWVHFNFLQVFSLAPWLFWAYFNWNETQNKRYALLVSFLICQMIFAGHMQTTFGALLGLVLTHLLLNYPFRLKKNVSFFFIILLGFMFAAPQILPTVLFSHYSMRGFVNTYRFVVSFIFNSTDIIGFYSSKALGSPRYATYGVGATGNRIYWENTPYLGELFIITLLVASIYYFVTYRKQAFLRTFFLLTSFFLLLSFGGDSPFYFLFGMFPLNMFRTPSRYLVPSVFFFILYAGIVFREIIKKHRIVLIFVHVSLMVNCFILVLTAFDYHLFVDSQKLLDSLRKLSTINPKSNYITFGGNEAWYKKFSSNGWKTNKDIDSYLFLNSALLPNSNLIAGLSTFDVYTGGLKMRRNEYLKSVIDSSLVDDQKGTKLENMLQLYNIGSIISLSPLYLPYFKPVQTEKKDDITIIVLQNPRLKNNVFYIPKNARSFAYLEDVEREIIQETVSEDNSFAESLPATVKQNAINVTIQIVKRDNHYLKSIVSTPEKKYIAVKKGWYPEWHLYIDGKESPIYKTNLIHMGFFVPKGRHTIEVRYVPTSFYIGIIIALSGVVCAAVLLILSSPRRRGSSR